MSEAEFSAYLALAIPDFAQGKVEAEGHERGLTGIALHVFGQNTGAQALYQKLGYLPTNINMFKQLPAKVQG